jgi:hypothetical protein
MKNPLLQHYIFHFDIYSQTWNAIPRDNYKDYWNTSTKPGSLRSDKLETLIEILDRMDRSINYLDHN